MHKVSISLFVLISLIAVFFLSQQEIFSARNQNTNLLRYEKSPYLLQHKDNPVWWNPWGKRALAKAKRENKPIFLSIGYSTCHWCHVMAHESFEDEGVAKVLNEHFISIKIDREERPDIDDIYMTAVQVLTGRGGWPMSVFLLPDGKPFYAGTYFPKKGFLTLLNQIAKVWETSPLRITADGERLTSAVEAAIKADPSQSTHIINASPLKAMYEQSRSEFDSLYAGFGRAPKFPQTMSLRALMRIHKRFNRSEAEQWIRKTLTAMSSGGMYDHLVGGFHRYSVDRKWTVPHFEKMLYDQAMLATTYLEAYQLFKDPEYLFVAEDILSYIMRDMTSPDGGFYSAEDADSLVPKLGHKEEGYFATWSKQQLQELLSATEYERLNRVFPISKSGNFEGRNILVLKGPHQQKARLDGIFEKLRVARNLRPKPHLDDKVVAAWNGWMISAFTRAYQVTQKSIYLKVAIRAMEFHEAHFYINGEMQRRFRDGEARFSAYADDYVAVIDAYINLYQSNFKPGYLQRAIELQRILDTKYWDTKTAGYFRDDGLDQTLLFRVKEDNDGVRPSANSLAVLNLIRLHALTYKTEYLSKADKILQLFWPKLQRFPNSLPQMLMGLDARIDRFKEIAIVPEPSHTVADFTEQIFRNFHPNIIVGAAGSKLLSGKTLLNDKTTYYICENKTCKLPTNDWSVAEKLIHSTNKLSW